MENKLIPTHKYKTTVVFFDDDKHFLDFLKNSLSSDKYNFRFVDNYYDFITLFNESEAFKKKLPSILVKINDELTDLDQHEVFDFDFSKFSEIHSLDNKDKEISLAFIDNDLGDLNGIQICTDLKSDTKKILLTGTSDLKNAVTALSEKHISNYVSKLQDPNGINTRDEDFIAKLYRIIEQFTDLYFIEKDYYINKLLIDKSFKALVTKLKIELNIIDHYQIGKDKYLLIDKNGDTKYLKCWLKEDFDQYYINHYDELNTNKNNFLIEVKEKFKFPIKNALIDSSKYEHLFYCIY